MAFNVSFHSRGSGLFGKIIPSAFGLLFAFFGTLAVRSGWTTLQETKAMQQWPQTEAVIISSEVQDESNGFRLALSYHYEINEKSYTAERYGENKFLTEESIGKIDAAHQRFPVGKKINCHYNPADPADAVLERPTMKSARITFALTFLFPGFGLLFATIPWLGGKKKKQSEASASSAGKHSTSANKWVSIFVGLIFTIVGLAMLFPLGIKPIQRAQAAKNWDAVSATVLSSKVKSHSSDNGTTYSVYVAYRYEVGGQEYRGDRYSLFKVSSSGYANKEKIVQQYPKNQVFDLYVNPNDPADAVIQRELGLGKFIILFPLIFAGVGILVLISGLRAKKPKLDSTQANTQIVFLKGTSPVSKAVGLLVFTVIWNGVVYLIFKSDAPILFLLIFGGVGLIMIAASLHTILAIFNPRPELEITPGNIRPGTAVSLRWRLSGRADRIGTLSINLQCLRVTTETSGSGKNRSTRTVKTPLYEKKLIQSNQQHEIVQGILQFRIPEDQPASIPGSDDGICWQIKMHGDIPRWPDLKQEFEFIVYPESLENS